LKCSDANASPRFPNAAHDRFDRTNFDGLGGFQPVTNDAYRKECGACHFAYLPGLLPSRSWNRVMDNLNNHFGENVELASGQSTLLPEYLTANATDEVPDKGAALLLERLDADKTPERITQIPIMVKNHVIVREVIKINSAVKARNVTNCDTCHQKAAKGSFALRDLLIPGLTKVVRPGGQF
jgi:hypothetical protein